MMKSTSTAVALLATASSAIKTETVIYPADPKLTSLHHQSNDSLSALKQKLEYAFDHYWFQVDNPEKLESEIESLYATAKKDFDGWNNALSAATEDVANLFVPTSGGSAVGCDNKKVATFLNKLWADKVEVAVKRLKIEEESWFIEWDISIELIDEYDEYVLMIENESDKPQLCEAADAWLYDETMIYPKDQKLEDLHHASNDSLTDLIDELGDGSQLTKQGDFSYSCSGTKDKVESALGAATFNFESWITALSDTAEDVADLGCDNRKAADFLTGLWRDKVESTITQLASMVQMADMNLRGQDFDDAINTLNEYDEVVQKMEEKESKAEFCKVIDV